ncbi:hypothetical protein CRUP_032177 [Coryphaenoides rupestris]|nr:hypothetical protein CRUP_032177 [Coryphaenoides rupestris]
MRTGVRMMMLLLLAALSGHVTRAQSDNNSNNSVDGGRTPAQQQPPSPPRGVWDEPIRFSTKSRDACTMSVSGAGDYTRLRVSCRGQASGRSYYCDFQGKPNLCRAYSQNPRHYFTQVMWELRKLSHACQGPRIYRPHMCKKYPDDAHMSFLSAWPKTSAGGTTSTTASTSTATATTTTPSKAWKPGQDQRRPAVPAQAKPASPSKPVKPQPANKPQPQPANKPQGGSGKAASQPRKPTSKQGKTPAAATTPRPTEADESQSSRLATEYCWKSLHGFCSYFMGWFHN